jgi:hypothetical protein
LTEIQVVQRRLFNQRIAGAQFDQPAAVVRWMGAMQAQDYAQAVWAVGLRTKSATLADVEQAIAAGKILRTWPMRGTIHFVAPEDARWMLRLTAAHKLTTDTRRQKQLDLNQAILEHSRQLFYDALNGSRRLSRPEMLNLLENAGIATTGQRGYHILWHAAQSGLICIGPMQDKQQTFVLLDEWAPDARDLPREEALAELARRYFTSHGPATLNDFAQWTKLPAADVRSALAAAQPGLVSQTIAGKEHWRQAGDSAAPEDPQRIDLLPGFDEYLLGYAERSAILASEHADQIAPGGNGVFRPMVVTGGQITGAWQRTVKKNSLRITLMPFPGHTLTPEHAFPAAQRYSQFLGLPLTAVDVASVGD